MILAIDVGNTNIVLGGIDDQEIYFAERISTDLSKTELEYAVLIKTIFELHEISPSDLEGTMISSVVPPLVNILKKAVKKLSASPIKVVGPGIKTGLNILMDNPAQLGSDLVVNAVAALAEYEPPLIIIDMGTATTISVVDRNGNYIGGPIIPGIRSSLESLVSRTSQLPRISMEEPKNVIGKNTVECMKSGIIYGNAALIDGMISRIREELSQIDGKEAADHAVIVATGGLSGVIIPLCREKIILDDNLLLKGLWKLYEKNR